MKKKSFIFNVKKKPQPADKFDDDQNFTVYTHTHKHTHLNIFTSMYNIHIYILMYISKLVS